MRLALVLLLVHGLVPALGEVTEAVVHLVGQGHLAHSEADHGDLGDQGDEHGCGTTQHLCGCCASLVVVPAPRCEVVARTLLVTRHLAAPAALVPLHEPPPPFRPPIAS